MSFGQCGPGVDNTWGEIDRTRAEFDQLGPNARGPSASIAMWAKFARRNEIYSRTPVAQHVIGEFCGPDRARPVGLAPARDPQIRLNSSDTVGSDIRRSANRHPSIFLGDPPPLAFRHRAQTFGQHGKNEVPTAIETMRMKTGVAAWAKPNLVK